MWKLKACPRCGGDVFIDKAVGAWYEQCLQCGYQAELRDIGEFQAHPERKKEPVSVKRYGPTNK
jgi:ribosomal protein S27AE